MVETDITHYRGPLEFDGDVEILADGFEEYRPEGGEPTLINTKKLVWKGGEVEVYAEVHANAEVSGKPVVPVHGLSSMNKTWDRDMRNELAARGYTVVVPDMPNHGKSGAMNHKGLTVNDYADKINDMLEGIGVKDYVLASSSGSAPFVMAMSEDYPESVAGVFCSAPVCDMKEIPLGRYYRILKPFLCALGEKFNIIKFVKNFQAKHRSQTEAEKELYLHSAEYDSKRCDNPQYKLTNKVLVRTMDAFRKYDAGVPPEVPFAIQFAEKDSIAKVKKFDIIRNKFRSVLSRYGLSKPPQERTLLELLDEKAVKYQGLHGDERPHVYLITGEVGHHIQKEAPVAYADNLRHFMQQIGHTAPLDGGVDTVRESSQYSGVNIREA